MGKTEKNHPESQIQQIAASIQQFGFNNPILADENLEIIAGFGASVDENEPFGEV